VIALPRPPIAGGLSLWRAEPRPFSFPIGAAGAAGPRGARRRRLFVFIFFSCSLPRRPLRSPPAAPAPSVAGRRRPGTRRSGVRRSWPFGAWGKTEPGVCAPCGPAVHQPEKRKVDSSILSLTTSFGRVSSALTSVNADWTLPCLSPPSDHDCPYVTVVGRSLSHADRTPCLVMGDPAPGPHFVAGADLCQAFAAGCLSAQPLRHCVVTWRTTAAAAHATAPEGRRCEVTTGSRPSAWLPCGSRGLFQQLIDGQSGHDRSQSGHDYGQSIRDQHGHELPGLHSQRPGIPVSGRQVAPELAQPVPGPLGG